MPFRENEDLAEDPLDSEESDPEDDDIDEDCSHCSCWEDGGTCCDCGETSPNAPQNEEEPTLPLVMNETQFVDDGSEEIKD